MSINTELWNSTSYRMFLILGLVDFEPKKKKDTFHYNSYRMKSKTMGDREKKKKKKKND